MDLFSLVGRLPTYIFGLWVIWLLATAGLVFFTARSSRLNEGLGSADQSIQVTGSPGTTVNQAGRDINLVQDPKTIRSIQTMTVEARLTCTLKPGANVPPSEVEFVPIGDAHAYLEGSTGRTRLTFVSPVRFRLVGSDHVTAINQFALDAASGIQNRPVEALAAFDKLLVPIVSVVYGNALETMTLLEVTVSINGDAVWYGSWKYNVPFQQGPTFSIPLDEFRRRIRG